MNGRPRRVPASRPLPRHPYRDSAILNAALACALLLLAWLTGGELERAVLVAAGFFLVATAWNWWRFRQRATAQALREPRARE